MSLVFERKHIQLCYIRGREHDQRIHRRENNRVTHTDNHVLYEGRTKKAIIVFQSLTLTLLTYIALNSPIY